MRFKGQRPGCAPSGALRPSLVVAIMAGLIFLSACDSAPSITERATSSDNADYETLTLKAIPQSDLPPEGTRSLFDHIIKENGVLPYPFEEVIALLASYDEQGRPPLTLLIPNGRSLLKGQANFAEPRIVVAATAKPQTSAYGLDPILRGRLFLGFVEGAEEIEIISYNEHAGRYEFQLVKDYAEGKVPKLVYAKRAICTTCHVGRGPIFPTRPWEETTAQPAIQQAIIKQRGTDAPYHGAKLDNVLADAENFDAMTDIGNVVPVTQRLWIDGCGPDGEAGQACRRQMLKLAIKYLWDPASFSENDAEADQLRELQAAHWPAGGIPLDNGDILNRNPFTDKPAGLPIVNWFKACWLALVVMTSLRSRNCHRSGPKSIPSRRACRRRSLRQRIWMRSIALPSYSAPMTDACWKKSRVTNSVRSLMHWTSLACRPFTVPNRCAGFR